MRKSQFIKNICFLSIMTTASLCTYTYAADTQIQTNTPSVVNATITDPTFLQTLSERDVIISQRSKVDLLKKMVNKINYLESEIDQLKKGNTAPISQTMDANKPIEPPKTTSIVSSVSSDNNVTKPDVSSGNLPQQTLSDLNKSIALLSKQINALQLTLSKKDIKRPIHQQKITYANDDERYYHKFTTTRGVSRTVNGFYYFMLSYGHGNKAHIGQQVNLSIKEMRTDFSVLDENDNLSLRYDDHLPTIIRDAIAATKEGGTIKIVTRAAAIYYTGQYPKNVTKSTPLVYEIKLNKIS